MPFAKAVAENKNLQKKKEFATNSMLHKAIHAPEVISMATSPVRVEKVGPFPFRCDKCSSDEQYLIQFWLVHDENGITDKILLCQQCGNKALNIACPRDVRLIGDP
ncbi:TPA: hypothetical protein RQK28_000684 [Vibrio vulnificus]|nr:hypothetical protein [Vibrio vulnificus]